MSCVSCVNFFFEGVVYKLEWTDFSKPPRVVRLCDDTHLLLHWNRSGLILEKVEKIKIYEVSRP